ncbi:hypothetical protein IFT47_27005 [Pseudomonas sp. CFBP 13711]|nr:MULTISPECIES: hypothetical protein [unclassified Pseudomonas]MBD8710276.1 hypothetical protein [Pseudomonas sp. CFBP 13711]MBD8715599.1 hypothetical protein [Pseudomonas sp. CFBP 13715]
MLIDPALDELEEEWKPLPFAFRRLDAHTAGNTLSAIKPEESKRTSQ